MLLFVSRLKRVYCLHLYPPLLLLLFIFNFCRKFLEQEDKCHSVISVDNCSCSIREKDDPITEPLSLTLTEVSFLRSNNSCARNLKFDLEKVQIFFGCEKRIPLRRQISVFGKSERCETKTFKVKILPGTPTGTKITFFDAGNQVHTQKPGEYHSNDF